MGFEESALTKLRRYREEVERSLAIQREIEETVRRFSERLFSGMEHAAMLGRRPMLNVEVKREEKVLVLRCRPLTERRYNLHSGFLKLPQLRLTRTSCMKS